jgi:hypothetical protein
MQFYSWEMLISEISDEFSICWENISGVQWTPCLLFIWNDNMREKREANANATWRELIRDRPRGDGV